MKKISYLLSAAVCTLTLATACSGSKSSETEKVTLTVETELGELGKYLSVTDKDVTITLSADEAKGDNKDGKTYKVIAASLAVYAEKGVASNYSISLDAEVLDENHIKVADLPDFEIDSHYDLENGDLSNVVQPGNTRAQLKHSVEVSKWEEKEQQSWDDICAKGKYIVVKPEWGDAKYAVYKNGSTSDESSIDTNSTEEVPDGDFDEWLTSYEEFYNEYLDLLKKASNGDMEALSEYPEMLKKAQELGEKMQKAQGATTPEQWKKYLELQTKLLKAAQEINE